MEAEASHLAGSKRSIFIEWNRYGNVQRALGKISHTCQSCRRRVRLHQCFTHITARFTNRRRIQIHSDARSQKIDLKPFMAYSSTGNHRRSCHSDVDRFGTSSCLSKIGRNIERQRKRGCDLRCGKSFARAKNAHGADKITVSIPL